MTGPAVLERQAWFPPEQDAPAVDAGTVGLPPASGSWWRRGAAGAPAAHPGGGALVDVTRVALLTLAALTLGLLINLVIGSGLAHRAAQVRALDQLQSELSLGTAPIAPVTAHHQSLAPGTPIALLEIPSIGVKEVVGEGTTSAVLMSGPGHLRSTIFPGGAGTSVILGRAEAYGGPFARIAQLHRGTTITVVTAVGTSRFTVVDVRHAGDVVPPLAPGQGRLTLATATESLFIPTGVVWVDADLSSPPLAAARPAVARVSADEAPLAIDTASLWSLVLWLLVLTATLSGAVWTWHRRGHAEAWILFSAPVVLITYFMASQAALLLPNLM